MKTLLYILHSGQLYGTERMAVATMERLAGKVQPVLFAPHGPIHAFAQEKGIPSHPFSHQRNLACSVWPYLASSEVLICSTGVSQALISCGLAALRGHWPHQIHIVHGGTDEYLSYGRKHWLPWLGIDLVAVSGFVRQRLLAHHCAEDAVHVIENFLTLQLPARAPFEQSGIRHAALISRIDPIKTVDLAIDVWCNPAGGTLPDLSICGTGWQADALRQRSLQHRNIHWLGFVAQPATVLLQSDLYIHTCANEPFGLAILEAMAVGVPVLVPDQGGAALLVEHGLNGFRYRAGDAADLRRQIQHIQTLTAAQLNAVVDSARASLSQRFSPAARTHDYAHLLGLI